MMGFGGFGGYSFPTRRNYGNPQSGQVLSDQEFGNTWREKMNSVPQYLTGTNTTQLVAGNEGYDANAAKAFVDPIRQSQRAAWDQAASGWSQQDRDANWTAALNMGYIPTIGEDGGIRLSTDAYTQNLGSVGRQNADALGFAGSHTVSQDYTYLNPEWDKLQKDWLQADKQRNENTIRQQQAYNTYLAGDGQIGGVMGEQYRNPAFGQVSGQKQGDVLTGMPGIGTGFGGITGVDDTSQTGAYAGGAGKYNPNPFAPGAFRNANPWA